MVRSFLNYLLPEDEYKRIRMVYFMAEAAFLIIVILLFFSFLNHYWLNWELSEGSFITFIIPMITIIYTYIRYILSGIEHTDIANKKGYKEQRRVILKRALSFGLIFFVGSLAFYGIPSDWVEAMNIIGPAIFSIIFYYIFDFTSLKRSYKKNKDLMDD